MSFILKLKLKPGVLTLAEKYLWVDGCFYVDDAVNVSRQLQLLMLLFERRDKSGWSRLGNVCYCLLFTFSLSLSLALTEGRQQQQPAWPCLGGEHGSHDRVRLLELSRGPHCTLGCSTSISTTQQHQADTTCSHQLLSGQASTTRSSFSRLVLYYFILVRFVCVSFLGPPSPPGESQHGSDQYNFLFSHWDYRCEGARLGSKDL